MKRTILALSVALAALITGMNPSASADECRGAGGCNKVCKLVKTEKTVTVTCYGYKYKDICLPGCACKGCMETECVKCGKSDCDCEGGNCKVRYSTDVPGCAKVRTIKQLVKYEVTKKVPAYKWEVVDAGGDGCDDEKNPGPSAPTQAK